MTFATGFYNWISCSLLSFVSMTCRAGDVDYLSQLYLLSLTPVVVLMLVLYGLLKPCHIRGRRLTLYCDCISEATSTRLRQLLFAGVLQVMFLVQPMVTSHVVR